MMSSIQELQQQSSSVPIDQLAMLHRSSPVVHHHSTGSQELPDQLLPLEQCHTCGSIHKPPHSSPEIAAPVTAVTPEKPTAYVGTTATKTKRSYCPFSSTLPEPFPKRSSLASPPNYFEGFVKLPLQESPAKQQLLPPPPLYRTLSDPTGCSAYSSYKRNSLQEITTPSPSPSPVKKPPLPPPLCRTLSDPTNCSPKVQQESPTAATMRLNRMKEGMREMSQWFNYMIDHHEDVVSQESNTLKDENEKDAASACDCEEAVWVERKGECLLLHFKCPCGKAYEILLLGNHCYYKLD